MYFNLGENEKAKQTADTLVRLITEKLAWLSTFNKTDSDLIFDEIDTSLYMFKNLIDQVERGSKDRAYVSKIQTKFMDVVKLFEYLIEDE